MYTLLKNCWCTQFQEFARRQFFIYISYKILMKWVIFYFYCIFKFDEGSKIGFGSSISFSRRSAITSFPLIRRFNHSTKVAYRQTLKFGLYLLWERSGICNYMKKGILVNLYELKLWRVNFFFGCPEKKCCGRPCGPVGWYVIFCQVLSKYKFFYDFLIFSNGSWIMTLN